MKYAMPDQEIHSPTAGTSRPEDPNISDNSLDSAPPSDEEELSADNTDHCKFTLSKWSDSDSCP